MKRIKIVKNWRNCYKWVSLHCMTIAAAVHGTWLWLPDDMRQSIPAEFITGITVFIMVLGIIGRFINQTKDL